jgi:hypothetical protein
MSGDRPFLDFYAAQLVRRVGVRIRTMQIGSAYSSWAAAHKRPTLSLAYIHRELAALGHKRMHSNGMYFGDLAVLDAPRSPAATAACRSSIVASDVHVARQRRPQQARSADAMQALLREVTLMRKEITRLRMCVEAPKQGRLL